MAWVAPVAQLGMSALSGMQGRSSSRRSRALMNEQLLGLRQQREIGREMYDRYKTTFAPIEGQIVDMSQTMATPDYAGVLRRSTGDYTRARDQTRRESIRTNNRMGIDPSNPMYSRGINRTNIADALALSTARNMSREAERNRTQTLGFDARMQAANLGRGMPATAIGAIGQSTVGMGQQAGIYGDQASSAYGAAGYFANAGIKAAGAIDWSRPGASARVDAMAVPQYYGPGNV